MPAAHFTVVAALAFPLVTVAQTEIELTGRVLETHSGVPVERARLAVQCTGPPARMGETVTNDEGVYRLKGQFTGHCRIESSRAGYANTLVYAGVDQASPVAIHLVKGAAISGRVTTDGGDPVRSALVMALPPEGNQTPPPSATTDGQGRYRIPALPPGRYAVGVVAATVAMPSSGEPLALAPAASPEPVSIGEGTGPVAVDFRLTLAMSGSIKGRAGSADAEELVHLALAPAGLPAAPIAQLSVDSGGEFEFRGIAAGSYLLFAAASSPGSGKQVGIVGPNPLFARLPVEIAPGDPTELNVSLAPGRGASFQLVAADETTPAACLQPATLRLTSLEYWRAQSEHSVAVSPSGPALVERLPPSQYAIRLTGLPQGCFQARDVVVDLTSGERGPFEIPVTGGAAAAGRLVPMEGAEREAVEILLLPTPTTGGGLILLRPDSTGAFSASGLRPGNYRLLVVGTDEWARAEWKSDAAIVLSLPPSQTTTLELPWPEPPPSSRRGAVEQKRTRP